MLLSKSNNHILYHINIPSAIKLIFKYEFHILSYEFLFYLFLYHHNN